MRTAFDSLGGLMTGFTPRESRDHDDDSAGRRYRPVFISDLHLGTPGCQATALLDFLKSHPSDYLYLVGDIVDGWQLRRRWYWPQAHNDVVQKLMRSARKGCRVVYVPGNHDEFARQFINHRFSGIEVMEEAVHVGADGKRLGVIHGDYFDGVIQCARWLAYLGDNLYEITLRLNRHLNSWRGRLGLPYWSLSAYLKHKVKKAEVLGRAHPEGGGSLGGAMDEDLQQACFRALAVPRNEARARALDFSWAQATELFVANLVPARSPDVRPMVDAARVATTAGSGS